jgi:peroxiredoxin
MITRIKSTAAVLSLMGLATLLFGFSYLNASVDFEDQGNILKVGDKAPELAYSNPDGATLKLSSLQGNIVLVHFWGSFAEGSKRENPNVVKLYEKYNSAKFQNNAAFDIFSVSLDKNKEDWKEGIKKEGLVWKHHVSDLQYWKSAPAQTYNVNSIPAFFLLDEKGVVIAKGLSVSQIQAALEKKMR